MFIYYATTKSTSSSAQPEPPPRPATPSMTVGAQASGVSVALQLAWHSEKSVSHTGAPALHPT